MYDNESSDQTECDKDVVESCTSDWIVICSVFAGQKLFSVVDYKFYREDDEGIQLSQHWEGFV